MNQYERYFGYVPNPEGTARFIESLPYFSFATAAPWAMSHIKDKEDVKLWLPLRKVHPSWKRGAQKIGDCFVAGTPVRMADGTEKPIENVVIGDLVVTPRNRVRPVIGTVKKPYSGELISIDVKGLTQPLTMTPDHELACYPGIGYGRGKHGRDEKDREMAWIPARDLRKGTRVLVPRGINGGPQPALDVARIAGGRITYTDDMRLSWKDNYNPVTPFVQVNEKFARLIGLYLAEGGISYSDKGSPQRAQWSFSSEETDLANETADLLLEIFGAESRVFVPESHKSVTLVTTNNKIVVRFLSNLIPGNVYSKRVPVFFINSPPAVKLALIRGWLDGDGHARMNKARGGHAVCTVGVTVSPGLQQDMVTLGHACNLQPKPGFRKKAAHQRVAARTVHFYGANAISLYPKWREEFEKVSIRGLQTSRAIVPYGFAAPIKEIRTVNVENIDVYCITVADDHSFVASGLASTNCVSWGAELCATMLMGINALTGEAEWLGEAATEAIYGGGRVEASGGGQGGWSDGSYGGAAAKWLRNWGVLLRKDYSKQTGNPEHDLTIYSGKKAKDWGNYGCGGQKDERGQGLLDKVAAEHPIKSTALVKTIEELVAALTSGCPVSVASGVGYGSMARNKDGVVRRSGSWSHQMMFGGVRWVNGEPQFRQFQSWGRSASGPDPGIDDDAISACSWWTVAEDAYAQIRGEDSFAFSRMVNFEPPAIDWRKAFEWFA